ncbi:MAG: hypothetical protein H6980_10250 [Gammaproteobacteria bacterium]|nr:hypothetical protein [Gammaproteobacteria bacterium]
MNVRILILSAALFLPLSVFAQPGDLHKGTVLGVIDGSTLRVARYGGGELRVRLPQAVGHDQLVRLYDRQRITVKESGWHKGLMLGSVRNGWEWPAEGVQAASRATD